MASMKIVSLLDSEIKTARQVMIRDFETSLQEVRSNINELQRAAHQLRVDVDALMQAEGTPSLSS
jgi:predicted component of type VI protein secretion system